MMEADVIKARADLTLALHSLSLGMVGPDAVTKAVEALVTATVDERERQAWIARDGRL